LFLQLVLQKKLKKMSCPPSHIVIVRHGEKPDDEKQTQLSAAGKKRAQLLCEWIPKTLMPHTSSASLVPAALYAPACKPSGASMRAMQTLMPASFALNVPLHAHVLVEQCREAAAELLGNHDWENRVVLVAWEHAAIADLVRELHRQLSYFSKKEKKREMPVLVSHWASDDYGSVLILTPSRQDGFFDVEHWFENLGEDDQKTFSATKLSVE
jgi:hypothetical protein